MTDFDDIGPTPRRVPHNFDAETALLGAVIISPKALTATIDLLDPDDFYKIAHRRAWAAMQTLHHNGDHIDHLTVADQIARDFAHEGVEADYASITSYIASIPHTTGAPRYARIVADYARYRRILRAATDLIDAAYSLDDTAIGHAGKTLAELLEGATA